MHDRGRFARIEMWNGAVLDISCVMHPDEKGSKVRVAILPHVYNIFWLESLLLVAGCLAEAADQKELIRQAIESVQTDLKDWDTGDEDEFPF